MKFTIATIHSAYGLLYIPDGKAVELELNKSKDSVSLVDLNWLRPEEDHKYIANIMFNDEIEGLIKVESALESYFYEQFDINESRLLWIPSFHEMHMFCRNFLEIQSVFDMENTILSKIIKNIATEVEVLVFHLGDKSLSKLGKFKSSDINEEFFLDGLKVKIKDMKVIKKSRLFEEILKNYSLYLLSQRHDQNIKEKIIKDDVQLEHYSKYGKLERI